jgi:adenosylcobalamin-dependent ribonucleoside-triphosphate reductase
MVDYDFQVIQRMAIAGAYSMATELKLPLPKNITTVKPSGTLSKIMDTTEGVHKPLGKYIFNNINFSKHDPLVNALREAGYKVQAHPTKSDTVLVTIPVKFEGVEFDVVDGKEVNKESAVSQLERYKMLQRHWTQQNTSVTISYDLEEVPSIITWLLENWDDYVGVSFIYRTDPSKTAADLGYQYLPQEVVTEEVWNAYNDSLLPVDIDKYNSLEEIKDQECAGGVCPIK